jgi:hypothetical protein
MKSRDAAGDIMHYLGWTLREWAIVTTKSGTEFMSRRWPTMNIAAALGSPAGQDAAFDCLA